MEETEQQPGDSDASRQMPRRDPCRSLLRVLVLWVVFGTGLAVQLCSPRLRVEHNAFVMPPAMVVGKEPVSPAELVARERAMQLISLILTLGGAIGLGIYYRDSLFKRRSP